LPRFFFNVDDGLMLFTLEFVGVEAPVINVFRRD